jgi:thioredoxin-like negative regulator of GroEL
MNSDYKAKYLKYKAKYLNEKKKCSCQEDNCAKCNMNNMTGGSSKPSIYLFKAEWCPHCRNFKPVWNELKTKLNGIYNLVEVDADKNKQDLDRWNRKYTPVQGFPTIMFKNGSQIIEYSGPNELDSIIKFIQQHSS